MSGLGFLVTGSFALEARAWHGAEDYAALGTLLSGEVAGIFHLVCIPVIWLLLRSTKSNQQVSIVAAACALPALTPITVYFGVP
jgi:hypothetical protein